MISGAAVLKQTGKGLQQAGDIIVQVSDAMTAPSNTSTNGTSTNSTAPSG
jgi:hypothetical protein